MYYEKLNNVYVYNKNSIVINKLVITIKLPSNIKYINGFITMLILLEKSTSNTPVFLKDINTLSRGRFIKIGLIIFLKSELIEQYLQLCIMHSIPKIDKDNITFNVPINNYNLFYNTNIMLSNTIFSFDNSIFQYYNYLNELIYNIEFIFYTNTKNLLINKFLINLYNLDIIIKDNKVIELTHEIVEYNTMLEFGDEEYNNINELEEDIDSIKLIDNILYNKIKQRESEQIEEFVLDFILNY
jgi:hypothetical protein